MSAPPTASTPQLIPWRNYCRNGFYPSTSFYTKLTTAENFLTAFKRKQVMGFALQPSVRAGSAGTVNLWRCRFRSGYGAKALAIYAVLGRPKADGVDPYTRIAITKVGGSTVNVDLRGGVGVGTPSDAPDQVTPTAGLTEIDPASAYEVLVSAVDYARPIALTIFEVGTGIFDTSTDYYVTRDVNAGGPILDSDQLRWGEGLMRMLRQNGGTQLNWFLYDGASRTRSSATLINIADNTTTGTPSTTSPGYRLDTTYRHTASRTTVPFEFAAYGSISAGSGTVVWKDTNGTTIATVTINSATPQWFTATGNVPAGTPKIDPLYAGDGTHTLNVSAVSAYEWEAA